MSSNTTSLAHLTNVVQAYANLTPSSIVLYRLRLAINTVAGAFNDNVYNSTSNMVPGATTLQSIQYSFYLSVATPTNYYFVFYHSTNYGHLCYVNPSGKYGLR